MLDGSCDGDNFIGQRLSPFQFAVAVVFQRDQHHCFETQRLTLPSLRGPESFFGANSHFDESVGEEERSGEAVKRALLQLSLSERARLIDYAPEIIHRPLEPAQSHIYCAALLVNSEQSVCLLVSREFLD